MMEYRKIPHGGEPVSVIGLGMGSLHESCEQEIEETVCIAIESGVNFFDMAASAYKPFPAYARAFAGRREKVRLQMHFGAYYENGKYGWTRDLKTIQEEFRRQLQLLHTDYTDMGYIHCVDEDEDLEEVYSSGLWDYMKSLHRDGVIRHLGFSSHNPAIARRLLDTGLIDLFMFSLNPAYDYTHGEYAMGSVSERMTLYQECEKGGVGISVMKPFSGGQLLSAGTSPFGETLTKTQCIQYALDKPAVLTVLPGVRGKQDLMEVLTFLTASPEEKDYSVIGRFTPQEADGRCVYCNHCLPCPADLNIGLINKYYDLSRAGDLLARNHYEKLSLHASDCISCGHCEKRCPFHVRQMARMEEIAAYFGK